MNSTMKNPARSTLKFALILGALTLGAAQAATGSTTTEAYASAAVQADVRATVLLDAAGRVVGTIDSAGRIVARGALETATRVQVVFESGAARTLDLAARVGARAEASAGSVIVKSGQGQATLEAWLEARAEATARTTTGASALLRGKTVVLIDAAGNAVGTFGADGRLRASGDVSAATDVRVTLEDGASYTFDLAADAAARANGMLRVETVTVTGESKSVALASVLARLNAGLDVTTGADARTDGGTESGGTGNAKTRVDGSASAKTGSSISIGTGGGTEAATEGEADTGISIGIGGGIGIGIGGGR